MKSCTNVDEVSLYLAIFPKGRHVAEARTCLKKLQLADDRAVMDDAFWNAVTSCTNVDEVSLYLEKFPKGRHVAEARACLKKLELSYLSTAERQGDPSKPRQSSPFAVRVLITYCIF